MRELLKFLNLLFSKTFYIMSEEKLHLDSQSGGPTTASEPPTAGNNYLSGLPLFSLVFGICLTASLITLYVTIIATVRFGNLFVKMQSIDVVRPFLRSLPISKRLKTLIGTALLTSFQCIKSRYQFRPALLTEGKVCNAASCRQYLHPFLIESENII